jgi:hypothetical protein
MVDTSVLANEGVDWLSLLSLPHLPPGQKCSPAGGNPSERGLGWWGKKRPGWEKLKVDQSLDLTSPTALYPLILTPG